MSGVVLSIADVVRSLDEFLDGNVSAAQVHEWAEDYDANEGIEFEIDALKDVVFELTSPQINGPVQRKSRNVCFGGSRCPLRVDADIELGVRFRPKADIGSPTRPDHLSRGVI